LKQQIEADYLRVLIGRDPSCTLKQLCDWIYKERIINGCGANNESSA